MLDNHWPSFFGHIFDYYLKPGGAYYGAKKGLRPLSVVFDYYATGDHSRANFTVVNQTPQEHDGLRVRVRIYDLDGKVREDRTVANIRVASGATAKVLTLMRSKDRTPVYFVRCELFDRSGKLLVDNVYWQSTTLDDLGDPSNDDMFRLKMASWADMTALNSMKPVQLGISATKRELNGETQVSISLNNSTNRIAFFERAEITSTRGGDEILPIEYDDNYVTVFPGEKVEIHGRIQRSLGVASWVTLEGYNTAVELAPISVPRVSRLGDRR